MANYSITIDNSALEDMEGIYRYFSRRLSLPAIAAKTVKNIEDEIRNNLSFMPYYAFVDDARLAGRGYRRMVVKKYLIFFVIDEEKGIVRVRRIIHGARDWQRILSEEQ